MWKASWKMRKQPANQILWRLKHFNKEVRNVFCNIWFPVRFRFRNLNRNHLFPTLPVMYICCPWLKLMFSDSSPASSKNLKGCFPNVLWTTLKLSAVAIRENVGAKVCRLSPLFTVHPLGNLSKNLAKQLCQLHFNVTKIRHSDSSKKQRKGSKKQDDSVGILLLTKM